MDFFRLLASPEARDVTTGQQRLSVCLSYYFKLPLEATFGSESQTVDRCTRGCYCEQSVGNALNRGARGVLPEQQSNNALAAFSAQTPVTYTGAEDLPDIQVKVDQPAVPRQLVSCIRSRHLGF